MRQPVFIVAAAAGALGFGVMNLLMAATPIAMQQCALPFSDAALVLQWHVIGMFAPGFFTGNLIKRFGALPVMGVGVALNLGCIVVALSGVELHQFLVALFLLGVGWNFLFTGSTTLSLSAYSPEERDRAQGALNFFVFATLAVSSLRFRRAGHDAGLGAAELRLAGSGGADRRGAAAGCAALRASETLRVQPLPELRSNTGSASSSLKISWYRPSKQRGADDLRRRGRGEGPAAARVRPACRAPAYISSVGTVHCGACAMHLRRRRRR